MKDKLVANIIRRLIKSQTQDFFNKKLLEFNNDIGELLDCENTVNEIIWFIGEKEEEAIKIIKERYNIDFDQFDFNTQVSIIKEVEKGILY